MKVRFGSRSLESAGLALRRAGGVPPQVTLKPWLAKVTEGWRNNASAKLALRRAVELGGFEFPLAGCGLLLPLYGKYIVGIKIGAGNFYNKIPANSVYLVLVVCIVDRIVGELEGFRDLKRNEQSI